MNIQLKPVTSSQIEAIGHDSGTNTLGIKFKSGGLYHYKNFTSEDMKKLEGAKSIGSHFHKEIKPKADKFPFTKVEDNRPKK